MAVHLHSAAPNSVDPLLTAIQAYRDGLDLYGKAIDGKDDWLDDDDALLAALVYKPGSVLENWRVPASSHEVALAAISVAEFERMHSDGSAISEAMEAAAIGYWKTAGHSKSEPSAAVEAPARVSLKELTPDMFLTALEAAAYLRVSEPTLSRWRCEKRGPIYSKAGGRILYRVSALLGYVAQTERNGTRPSAPNDVS